jgi:hypothetical protein
MPMVPFFSKVGERAFKEMHTLIVMKGKTLPSGPYGLLEFYCDEADCDCRRVLFHVIRPDSGEKIWATINFGWETREYYRTWSHDGKMADEMAGASLEPLGSQTKYSAELLALFIGHVQPNAAYIAGLTKHYAEVKRLCRQGSRHVLPSADQAKGRKRTRRRHTNGP